MDEAHDLNGGGGRDRGAGPRGRTGDGTVLTSVHKHGADGMPPRVTLVFTNTGRSALRHLRQHECRTRLATPDAGPAARQIGAPAVGWLRQRSSTSAGAWLLFARASGDLAELVWRPIFPNGVRASIRSSCAVMVASRRSTITAPKYERKRHSAGTTHAPLRLMSPTLRTSAGSECDRSTATGRSAVSGTSSLRITALDAASMRSVSSSSVSRPSAAASRSRSTVASRSGSEARTSIEVAPYANTAASCGVRPWLLIFVTWVAACPSRTAVVPRLCKRSNGPVSAAFTRARHRGRRRSRSQTPPSARPGLRAAVGQATALAATLRQRRAASQGPRRALG